MLDEYFPLQTALAIVCWGVTFLGATAAVFSSRISDTLPERIGLSSIAIGSVGMICRIGEVGKASDAFSFLSIALAGYVVAVVWKHLHEDDTP